MCGGGAEMKRPGRVLILYIVLFLMLICTPVSAGQSADHQKRVLFISSYTLAWPTVPYQIKGIQEALDHDIALEYAFMGTKTYDDETYRQQFHDRLKYQLEHVEPYDVIIVGDDAAFDFAIRNRAELFPETPLIFEGVNDIELAKKESAQPLVTGVVEEVPVSENIDIALKINPDADKVISILDNSASGIADQKQMEALSGRYPSLAFSNINSSELSRDELSRAISAVDQNSILIYQILSADKDGNIYTSKQAVDLITRYSRVPVYRIVEAGIGDGLFGGEFVDHEESGKIAGTMAMKYFNGEDLSGIPPILTSPETRWFDWNVMQKFGISRSQLPADAVILNERPTFWQLYGKVLSIFTAVTAVIVFFIIFLIRFKDAEKHGKMLEKKNEQLAMAVEAANRASYAKSCFLSNMSHEIRTPMNAILGLTSLARLHEADPETEDTYLARIQTSSGILQNILNDILDMSAIENKKLKLQEEPFDLNEVLASLQTIYGVQCEEKGSRLILDSRIRNGYLRGDRTRVNQILLNLVSNAWKFTPAGGSITIRAEETFAKDDQIWCRFTVQDNGEGMDQSMVSRLFLPFEQESAETAQNHGGTGLGLSIAQNLVSLMHGTIRAESEKNKGTTFTVDIPFHAADRGEQSMLQKEHKTQEKAGLTPDAYDFTGKRILIAEDNEINREILIELLRLVKADVDYTVNGEEVLRKFTESAPGTYDAILMDIRMPVMNGLEAARNIRASAHPQAASVPIYAMTANAFTSDISECISAGMNGHIAKPVNTAELYEILKKVLFPA